MSARYSDDYERSDMDRLPPGHQFAGRCPECCLVGMHRDGCWENQAPERDDDERSEELA